MMTSFDELLLERFVRDASALSETEVAQVDKILTVEPYASELVGFFRQFYEAFDAEPEELPAHVHGFVDALFEPVNVFELAPYRTPDFDTVTGLPYPTVLAAATATSNRFETLATLISREQNTLARLILDRDHGEANLFVLSNQKRKYAHVLISFRNPDLVLVTDDEGRAQIRFDSEMSPLSIRPDGALVKTPVEAFNVEVADFDDSGLFMYTGEQFTVELESSDNNISIIPTGHHESAAYCSNVVVEWNESQAILPVIDNGCELSIDPIPKQLSIRLYV